MHNLHVSKKSSYNCHLDAARFSQQIYVSHR